MPLPLVPQDVDFLSMPFAIQHKSFTLAGAAALVVMASGIAIERYSMTGRMDNPQMQPPSMTWLGPSGRALQAAIGARLSQVIETLNDNGGHLTERAPAYIAQLQATELLIHHALLANPLDSRGIVRLAAVRWELDVLLRGVDGNDVVALLDLADARAPRIADVHVEHGAMLYRIGRGEEAPRHLAQAISLEPQCARRVVELMRSFDETPGDIAGTLPSTPEVLLALEAPFFEAGLHREYLTLIETVVDSSPVQLLAPYGDACLRAGNSQALLVRLSKPFQSDNVLAEPLRYIQRARALVQLGQFAAARNEVDRARAMAPNDPMVLEAIGGVGMSSGLGVEAAGDFRDALAAIALRQDSAKVRGRLYREIGQAEELAGRPELAFDAYRRALESSADDDFARARIAIMERAAGYHAPVSESH
jgi:Flp pilus assembly protein TadD